MAVVLNGTSQYLWENSVDCISFYPTPMSFSGWFKFANKATDQTFFQHNRGGPTAGSGSQQAGLSALAAETVRQYCTGQSSDRYQTTTATETPDAWNHVGASFNGAACKLWLNGASPISFTSAGAYADNAAATWNLVLGAWKVNAAYTNFCQGRISQCAIYNVELSDANILSLQTLVPSDVAAGSLRSYWSLQTDGSDTIARLTLVVADGATFSTSDEPPLGGAIPAKAFGTRRMVRGSDVQHFMRLQLK